MYAVLGMALIIIGGLGGLVLAAWLGGYVMLYQGITGAIEAGLAHAWTSMAGSIIKAMFFEVGALAGFAGAILVWPGIILLDYD